MSLISSCSHLLTSVAKEGIRIQSIDLYRFEILGPRRPERLVRPEVCCMLISRL